jgi:hypothetical protein
LSVRVHEKNNVKYRNVVLTGWLITWRVERGGGRWHNENCVLATSCRNNKNCAIPWALHLAANM